MRHVLVVANKTLVGSHLTSRVYELSKVEPIDVYIVVPFAVVGDGSGYDRSTENLQAGIDAFERLGVTAAGTVAHRDPMVAIERALETRPAVNLVLLSTLELGRSAWIAMDLPHRVQRRFDVAVEHIIGSPIDVAEQPAADRPVSVFLVEDNPADVELATVALEGIEHDVDLKVATDGASAIEYVAVTVPKPDLILADLKMPVMDGFSMLEGFASRLGMDTLRDLNVVVVSSSAAEADRDRAHALGARAYVVKDPDFDRFQATLASLVGEVARNRHADEVAQATR